MAGIEVATGELMNGIGQVADYHWAHAELLLATHSYFGDYREPGDKPLQEHHTYNETPDRG